MNSDARELVADMLHFSGVQPCPDLDPEACEPPDDLLGAADACRPA